MKISKNKSFFALLFLLSIFYLLPTFVSAQSVEIPCGQVVDGELDECMFNDLLLLFQNIIEFLGTYLLIPAATISFAYFGFKLLLNPDKPAARDEAKKGLMKVVIGLAVIISAGLIVKFILDALLSDATADATRLINL